MVGELIDKVRADLNAWSWMPLLIGANILKFMARCGRPKPQYVRSVIYNVRYVKEILSRCIVRCFNFSNNNWMKVSK
jgi:hypothetical protein